MNADQLSVGDRVTCHEENIYGEVLEIISADDGTQICAVIQLNNDHFSVLDLLQINLTRTN